MIQRGVLLIVFFLFLHFVSMNLENPDHVLKLFHAEDNLTGYRVGRG